MSICILCGSPPIPEEKQLKYFDLPTNAGNPKWHTRFMNELGIIVENDQQLRNMKICEKHFNPEDITIENNISKLKENALPINNLIESFDHYYIKPEMIDVNIDGTESESNDKSKHFTTMDPLVVCSYNNSESDQEGDCSDYVAENVETEIIEPEDENKFQIITQSTSDKLNCLAVQDNEQTVEPMMPFFLSEPSVFTILNANNEVGETIIVQIENHCQEGDVTNEDPNEVCLEEEQDVKPLKVSRNQYVTVPSLERSLCSSNDRDIGSTYVCDICDNSYGCINCLKSHYDSVHICRLEITQYKCHNSPNCPKGLYCPVCSMVFKNRTETLDHYVTHYAACEICCAAFDRPSYLSDHMKNKHNKVDKNFEYECELCRNFFQYSSYLSKHYQVYHKMNLCITCMTRFKTVEELYKHEHTHLPKANLLPYACSLCDKAFPKVSDITVHIRAMHKYIPGSTPLLKSLEIKQVVQRTKQSMKTVKKSKPNLTKKVKIKK